MGALSAVDKLSAGVRLTIVVEFDDTTSEVEDVEDVALFDGPTFPVLQFGFVIY